MDTTEPMGTSIPAPIPSPSSSGITKEAAPHKTVRHGTYELMVIIPATLSDEDAVLAKSKIAKLLTEQGSTISGEEDLGKRKLAFPIKHVRQGFYHVYALEGSHSIIKQLNQSLLLTPEVLRHLITVRTVRTEEQLAAQAALRERIQAKRVAAEERAVADRHKKDAEQQAVRAAVPQPTREVSKEELDKKLEELLTDDTLGQ